MLAYPRKDHAVRSLKENFIEEIDFQVIPKNGENPKGGRPTNEYYLSTSCLEYFIARKVRPVFEVYRQVFHKVAGKAKEKLYKESEIKEYLVKAEMTLRAAKAEAEAAKKLAKKLEEQLWEEKARVVIESEKMEKEKDLKNSCFGYLIQTKQYNQWKEYDVKARIKSTAERLQREQKKKDVRPYELPF
jgi:heterodisulfide reductase subunit B